MAAIVGRFTPFGVRLVTALLAVPLAAPLSGQQPLEASRLLREMVISGETEDLTIVHAVAVSPRGTIAVGQNRDGRVLFYSPEGKRIGEFGRTGEGPGEFRLMSELGWRGDTLWITDEMLPRVTIVGPDRRLARTQPFPRSSSVAPFDKVNGLTFLALGADGSMLISGAPKADPSLGGPTRQPASRRVRDYFRREATVEAGRRLARRPPTACVAPLQVPGGEGLAGIPFCQSPLSGVAPDGSRIGILSIQNPFAEFRTLQLTVITARGDTVLSRDIAITPIPVTMQEVMTELVNPPGRALLSTEQKQTAVRAVGIPRQLPGATALRVSNDGTVWLETPTRAATHTWVQLSPAGIPRRRVELPASSELLIVEGELLWTRETDADGLHSVVRYRIGAPTASGKSRQPG